MKKLTGLAVLAVLAVVALAGSAWGEEKVKHTNATEVGILEFKFLEESKEKAPAIERKIVVDKQKEFIEVTVYPKDAKPIVYRIWPCGMIQKMEWKEVAPNVERSIGTVYFSGSSITTLEARDWGTSATIIK